MIPLPEQGFKYYTLHYLNLWISQDQPCYYALAGDNRERKLKELANAAADYGIARTLPKRFRTDKGPERYGPVLNIIDRQKPEEFRHLRPHKLAQRINTINVQIQERYKSHHQLLSLTTKFLWLKMRSPIIIYDRRARKALRAATGDIEEYYRLWREDFERHERPIRNACASLHKVNEYTKNPAVTTREYVAKIASQRWFRERVFDVYLWDIGGNQGTN